ncbi:hypothetical protein PIB30_061885 [Stylosanthes scabra]|uniref:Uncharacterized protein n=1 Tax=Stylosanthes scabra TaxID=79078 RepID=A0ABU6TMN5_9FABA|nr:hypothetical protein [Stylosanthes scabra]
MREKEHHIRETSEFERERQTEIERESDDRERERYSAIEEGERDWKEEELIAGEGCRRRRSPKSVLHTLLPKDNNGCELVHRMALGASVHSDQ